MSLFTFNPKSDRIALAHKRLADAYRRVPGAEIPIVEPGARAPIPDGIDLEKLDDFDRLLHDAAAWANGLAAGDNDWPPMINTLCGVVFVAEAFGCEIVYSEGNVAWTKPVTMDIADVWKIKPMKVGESPLIRRLSRWIDYAQRKLGTDVPMWTMDLQCPFSVAAHVVEPTELLAGCISDPKAVHHLCQMVTDFSIEHMRQHLAEMEHPAFPGRNFPSISENVGICIADDTPLIMLSPQMYREFSLPYNNQIGEAFGGVHVHSCGDYRHNIDNLLQITNVRSIQAHVGPGEFPLPETASEDCPFNRARRRVACFIDTNGLARGRYRTDARRHYSDYVLPRVFSGDTTGIILQSCGTGDGVPDTNAALAWTRSEVGKRKTNT